MSKKTTYKVSYYTLEPSYYDRSEREYHTCNFTKRQEALDFADAARKKHPAQILVTRTTEEVILDLRDTDDYQENRV